MSEREQALEAALRRYVEQDERLDKMRGQRFLRDSDMHRSALAALTEDRARLDWHQPYLCIAPVCGEQCGQCTYAISPQDQRDYARRYAHLRSMSESGCSVLKFNGDGGVDTDDILIGGHLDSFIDAELAALSPSVEPGSEGEKGSGGSGE